MIADAGSRRAQRVRIALLARCSPSAPVAAARSDDADDIFRVCADPNNLPFSNRAGEGFENKLAEFVAGNLGKRVSYTWWAQRRGFIRNTLKAGDCDVVMGIPAQARHGRGDAALLPLDLRLRIAIRSPLCAAFDQGRPVEGSFGRGSVDRRRRIQHAARTCA